VIGEPIFPDVVQPKRAANAPEIDRMRRAAS
jgi:hypothetical protein